MYCVLQSYLLTSKIRFLPGNERQFLIFNKVVFILVSQDIRNKLEWIRVSDNASTYIHYTLVVMNTPKHTI